jgi:hypothetical protein
MEGTNNSLAETFDELSAIAGGLGLVLFVGFPFGIPFIALMNAFAAPLLVLMAVLAVLATPPLLAAAALTRRLRRRRVTPAYRSGRRLRPTAHHQRRPTHSSG